tara:strand:- start:909 stop:1118 length:210 start_codon:yes stop_codon:yes gene_type:complete
VRLKQLVKAHKESLNRTRVRQAQVHDRVRKWADDGKSLSEIQEETGYSFRHLGFILGRKKYEEMVLDRG